MVLKLELSDAIRKRIEAAAAHKNLISVEAFVRHAIETELRRVEGNGGLGKDSGDLASLAKQVERIEEGQRAIVALVDSSAAILAELLRGPRARG